MGVWGVLSGGWVGVDGKAPGRIGVDQIGAASRANGFVIRRPNHGRGSPMADIEAAGRGKYTGTYQVYRSGWITTTRRVDVDRWAGRGMEHRVMAAAWEIWPRPRDRTTRDRTP